jgi:chemotaxis protein CheZ
MQQYIGFRLNANEFTIPIMKVREIINTPPITQLPQAPHYLKGILNLRGQVIPIVDLKELITAKGEPEEGKSGGKVIVITNRNITFGILVDSITSVINIDDADIEPPQGLMADESMDKVEGVARFDDRLIILLDTDKLVNQDEVDILDTDIDITGLEDVKGEEVKHIAAETVRPRPAAARPAPPEPRQSISTAPPASEAGDTQSQILKAKDILSSKFSDDEARNDYLNKLVELMETMASKKFDVADRMISEMLQHGESDLFNRIGRVTRKLHNSLREFRNALDPRIKQIANEDVPQAVDRLEYVISKSEEAAHKTMGVVEKYQLNMPELIAHIEKVSAPEDSKGYLQAFSSSLGNDLNEVMLAQEFQDITGQTIHRVIDLVNTIEAELIGLIATFGDREGGPDAETLKPGEAPKKITQDEVEDLLKEFGF